MKTVNTKSIKDFVEVFDADDIYNSSAIYQIPRVQTTNITLNYLRREDLVSKMYLGNSRLYGLIVVTSGYEGDGSPGDILGIKSPPDIYDMSYYNVNYNSMTTKNTNPYRNPPSRELIYENGRFKYRD